MEVPVAVAGWANHADTFMSLIDSYKTKELFCDCTLACDRKMFRAHKMILAMSSELFENIFIATEDKNPVIILHEIEAWQVECLLNYMYKGETRVSDSHFISLCKVAKSLQIKGFDKLELYREAVKQSKKKDSRLISKTEESRNDNFFTLQPDKRPAVEPRQLYSSERRKRPVKLSNTTSRQEGIQVPATPQSPPFISPHRQVSPASIFPVSLSSQVFTPLPAQDAPTKSHSQKDERKSEEPSSAPFSVRCNYHSSPNFNFKKNYLLSTSASCSPPFQSPKPKSAETAVSPQETSHSSSEEATHKLHTNPEDSATPTLFQNFNRDELQTSSEETEVVSVDRQKSLRKLPPLLRIMYNNNSNNSSEPIKMKTEEVEVKSEAKPECPYKPVPRTPPSNQPSLDTFLHLNLTSDPGSDPLLQKIPTNKRKRVRGPKSWEFLLRLLRSPESNPSLIKWENEDTGVFRLIRPDVIAFRWGRRTGKHVYEVLSYESFSRGLRYHYATGALCAVSEKSFVYQFGPKALQALQMSRKPKIGTPNTST